MKLQEVGYSLKQTATKKCEFWCHSGWVLSNNGDVSGVIHGQELGKLLLSGYWSHGKTVKRFLTTRPPFMDWNKSEAFSSNIKKVTADYVDSQSLKCSNFPDPDTFYFEMSQKEDFNWYSPYFDPWSTQGSAQRSQSSVAVFWKGFEDQKFSL